MKYFYDSQVCEKGLSASILPLICTVQCADGDKPTLRELLEQVVQQLVSFPH